MTGLIFDIKEFGVHDGDGLRTTVFLKGCPLRCVWCHNPEGLEPRPELSVRTNSCRHCGLCRRGCSHPDCQPYGRCLHVCPEGLIRVCGEYIEADVLCTRILANERILREGRGGVTFSGGEPLMQAPFLTEVLEKLHGRLHIAVETSGFASEDVFRHVIGLCDFVFMDVKLTDDGEHRKYCGVSNALILRNLELLRSSGVPCRLRTPLIPGINDDEAHRQAVLELAGALPHEFLPYNSMAGAKYPMFGRVYPYGILRDKA